jgi:hypothetical protein
MLETSDRVHLVRHEKARGLEREIDRSTGRIEGEQYDLRHAGIPHSTLN